MSTEFANESHGSPPFHPGLSYCGKQGIVRRLPLNGYFTYIAGMAITDMSRLELELKDHIDWDVAVSGADEQDCYEKLV